VKRDIPRVNEKGFYVKPGAMGGRLGDSRAEEAVEREGEESSRA
jgi:hypothetical protein